MIEFVTKSSSHRIIFRTSEATRGGLLTIKFENATHEVYLSERVCSEFAHALLASTEQQPDSKVKFCPDMGD